MSSPKSYEDIQNIVFKRGAIMKWKGAIFILITVSCTVCGQILMKKGMLLESSINLKRIIANYQIILGGLFYIASFIFWLNVLKILPLSIAYPSASIAYVGVVLASAIFLAERITVFKIIGLTLICIGVIFIGM